MINYPLCSSAIIDVSVDDKKLNIDKIYRIFGNLAFGNELSFSTKEIGSNSVRGLPYIELLYPSTTESDTYYVYSNFPSRNTINTNDGNDLIINDCNVVVNDKRFWVMDFNVKIQDTSLTQFNISYYKSIPFKKNYNLKATFQIGDSVQSSSTLPYTKSTINRSSIWSYYPNTTIYLLINIISSVNLEIYVMQSFCNQIDKTLNINNLVYLSNKLLLPPGWIYTYLILDSDSYLNVVNVTSGTVLQDDLNNTYTLLDPKYASWLYEMYSYLTNN